MNLFSRSSLWLLGSTLALALFPVTRAVAADDAQRLVNLSSRALVGTGDNVLISGFVIENGPPKKILIRAAGPALADQGVSGVLANPVVSLFDAHGVSVASNDDWSASDASTMSEVGAFGLPPGSRDSALVATVPSGAYTAVVSGVGDSTGVALVEIYDVSGSARLINLSTRALVGSGSNTLIAGLVVAAGSGTRHLLIRAGGPALLALNVSNANADPALTVFDGQGRPLATNDNWGTANTGGELTAAIAQSGAYPFQTGSKDAALLLDVASGSFSIHVAGVGGATGPALVEVYDLTSATSPPPVVPGGSPQFYLASLHPLTSAAGSTAYGTATLQLAADESSVLVNLSFANLTSPEVVAHLVLDGNFLTGLPKGQVNQFSWTLRPVGTYSIADLVAALKSGRIAVQIDSARYSSGELAGRFVLNTATITFIPPAPAPAVDLSHPLLSDAARFLGQATFGPVRADIDDLVKTGYVAWLDAQMALPATPQRAYTMDDFALYNGGGQGPQVNGLYPYPGGTHRQAAWWRIAMTAPDQLRQRVAFALSEIFVVSDQDFTVNTWQEGAANYYDVLVANAFGNFRTLLEQVTLHPIMGVYLSAIRNGKAAFDSAGRPLTAADENYAREIMQLFTIGLNELNPDGTLRLDATGQPIPTYNQTTIVETAKVLTGWGFFSTDGARDFRTTGGKSPQDWLLPMMLYPEFHDDTAKTIIGGRVLPAGQGGTKDLKDLLDALFNHPNTGPLFARQLIQRLVTSNPTPGYVYRVAQVFAHNGHGVRGDIGAVVRAILLDYEARSSALLNAPARGKLKEPLLRGTALLRAIGATSDSGRYNIDAYPSLAEAPLRSTTVFNFFEPDYALPGAIAAAGLRAPEFQILTDTTAITMANFFQLYLYNLKPALPSAENRETIYPRLDAWLPLARTPQALVDELNLVLCAGNLSVAANTIIVNALTALPASTSDVERVRTAFYLVAISPDGALQK